MFLNGYIVDTMCGCWMILLMIIDIFLDRFIRDTVHCTIHTVHHSNKVNQRMDKLCSKGTMVGRRLDNIWYFPDIYVSIYVTQYTILSYTPPTTTCRTRFQIMWIHYIFFFGTTYLVHSTVCKLNIIMEQLFRYIYRYLPAGIAANTAIVDSVLWYGLVTHGTLALQNWNRFLYKTIVSSLIWSYIIHGWVFVLERYFQYNFFGGVGIKRLRKTALLYYRTYCRGSMEHSTTSCSRLLGAVSLLYNHFFGCFTPLGG